MCYPLPTKLGNCRIGNVIIILLLLWSHCQKENNFRYFHPSEGISQVDQLGAGREVCLDGPEGTHQDRQQEDLLTEWAAQSRSHRCNQGDFEVQPSPPVQCDDSFVFLLIMGRMSEN